MAKTKWESPKGAVDKGKKWLEDVEQRRKLKSQKKVEKLFPFLKK